MKLSEEEVKIIIKDTIKKMYGKLVYNTYDNLYREPYAFKAYDIIYILVAVFDKLGYRNIEIEDELLDKTTFSSVESISQFILSI